MKVSREAVLTAVLAIAVSVAVGKMDTGTFVDSDSFTLFDNSLKVTSEVYLFSDIQLEETLYDQLYLYAYQLESIAYSPADWFFVEIAPSVEVLEEGMYSGPGQGVIPLLPSSGISILSDDSGLVMRTQPKMVEPTWQRVSDPAAGMRADFDGPLTTGDVSAVLWYLSTSLPGESNASAGGNPLTVIAPIVPEPATLILLGAGVTLGIGLRKRRYDHGPVKSVNEKRSVPG